MKKKSASLGAWCQTLNGLHVVFAFAAGTLFHFFRVPLVVVVLPCHPPFLLLLLSE